MDFCFFNQQRHRADIVNASTLYAITMTPNEIIDNEANILECARSFRQDANNLMTDLSKDFNFSLAISVSSQTDIYDRKYNNKGIEMNGPIIFTAHTVGLKI